MHSTTLGGVLLLFLITPVEGATDGFLREPVATVWYSGITPAKAQGFVAELGRKHDFPVDQLVGRTALKKTAADSQPVRGFFIVMRKGDKPSFEVVEFEEKANAAKAKEAAGSLRKSWGAGATIREVNDTTQAVTVTGLSWKRTAYVRRQGNVVFTARFEEAPTFALPTSKMLRLDGRQTYDVFAELNIGRVPTAYRRLFIQSITRAANPSLQQLDEESDEEFLARTALPDASLRFLENVIRDVDAGQAKLRLPQEGRGMDLSLDVRMRRRSPLLRMTQRLKGVSRIAVGPSLLSMQTCFRMPESLAAILEKLSGIGSPIGAAAGSLSSISDPEAVLTVDASEESGLNAELAFYCGAASVASDLAEWACDALPIPFSEREGFMEATLPLSRDADPLKLVIGSDSKCVWIRAAERGIVSTEAVKTERNGATPLLQIRTDIGRLLHPKNEFDKAVGKRLEVAVDSLTASLLSGFNAGEEISVQLPPLSRSFLTAVSGDSAKGRVVVDSSRNGVVVRIKADPALTEFLSVLVLNAANRVFTAQAVH